MPRYSQIRYICSRCKHEGSLFAENNPFDQKFPQLYKCAKCKKTAGYIICSNIYEVK